MRLLIAILLAAISVSPVSSQYDLGAMKGISEVGILIEDLEPNEKAADLTKSQLRNVVELKTRLAGIKVVDHASSLLYVNAQVMKRTGTQYIWHLTFRLNQVATVVHNGVTDYGATTWEKGTLGYCPRNRVRDQVSASLNEFMDAFLIEWLKQNPK